MRKLPLCFLARQQKEEGEEEEEVEEREDNAINKTRSSRADTVARNVENESRRFH